MFFLEFHYPKMYIGTTMYVLYVGGILKIICKKQIQRNSKFNVFRQINLFGDDFSFYSFIQICIIFHQFLTKDYHCHRCWQEIFNIVESDWQGFIVNIKFNELNITDPIIFYSSQLCNR